MKKRKGADTMILAIDIGNTNIELGCIEEGRICSTARIQTDVRATASEYTLKFKQLLEFNEVDPKKLEGVIIASVVPVVTIAASLAIERLTGKKSKIVGPGMKTGMNVRIDDPGSLAADLLVGSIAAREFYHTPAIILDMGTATTLVVVDRTGSYRGGAIVPGIKLSYEALAAGTSLLPDISIAAPKKCIATNTVDSMRSGAIFGNAAMIDGMIDRMEAELGESCTVVATGGLARQIISCCKHEIIYDGELILKGLWTLYRKNK